MTVKSAPVELWSTSVTNYGPSYQGLVAVWDDASGQVSITGMIKSDASHKLAANTGLDIIDNSANLYPNPKSGGLPVGTATIKLVGSGAYHAGIVSTNGRYMSLQGPVAGQVEWAVISISYLGAL